MTTNSSDAGLVAGHLAGDPSALAGIYDRYSDSLHDTAAAMLNDRSEAADVLHDVILIAAERMGQLRDPDRLKPWLFAILRNEVYRRTKKRRRTIATDFSGSEVGFELVDDRGPGLDDTVADVAAGDDLAELVRGAARGLDERDQLVLELSVRQGLGGQDLADALGVSTNQSYTLVHRMRERVERSLAAYVVARAGRNDCDELDRMLGSWDGEFTVLIRKRVARHVDKCEVCDDRRRRVAPLAMFASAPVYAAPAALRDRILGDAALRSAPPTTPYEFTAHDGFPQVVRAARRVAAWVAPTAAASLVLVVAGLSVVWLNSTDDGDTLLREATGELTVRTTDADGSADPDPTSTPSSTTTLAETVGTNGASTTTTTTPAGPSTTAADPAADAASDPTKDTPSTTIGSAATTAPATTTAPRTATTAPNAPVTTPAPATPVTTAPPRVTTTTTTTAPPRPGRLSVSGGTIDLGTSATSGSVTVTNTGDLPIDFSVTGNPAPFAVGPTSGTLAGGASMAVTATIDRANMSEGATATASVQIFGAASTFNVNLSARTAQSPPSISGGSPTSACAVFSASVLVSFQSVATITDQSGVANATFSVSGPGGHTGSTAMSGASTWTGVVQVNVPAGSGASGSWSWSITATDTLGNVATAGGTTTVSC